MISEFKTKKLSNRIISEWIKILMLWVGQIDTKMNLKIITNKLSFYKWINKLKNNKDGMSNLINII
jgi:hypothetical protein